MRWTSRTMARHDSVAVGNALRRKSIEKCSFSRLKPRIFACGAPAAGCAGESVFLDHARVNRLCTRVPRARDSQPDLVIHFSTSATESFGHWVLA